MRKTILKTTLFILILLLAWYGNRQYQHKKLMQEVQIQIALEEKENIIKTSTKEGPLKIVKVKRVNQVPKKVPRYHCDGRQHCSQMRSYEEAKFFLDHCRDTLMDGDNDGIPCERQFNRY